MNQEEQKKFEESVREVEQEFIDAGKIFTAIDVGNALKSQGINVRQRDVSPVVREHFQEDMYSDAHYTREIIFVNDGQNQAFVYFNIDRDPNEYLDTKQKPLPWDPSKSMYVDGDVSDKAIDSGGLEDNVIDANDDLSADGIDNDDSAIGLVEVVASKNSKVYHSAGCFYAKRIETGNRVEFADTKTATDSDYRKCMRE